MSDSRGVRGDSEDGERRGAEKRECRLVRIYPILGRMADRETIPLPLEVRARLAELELELSEGKFG